MRVGSMPISLSCAVCLPGADASRLADVSVTPETTGAVLPVTAIEEGNSSSLLSLAERRRRAQLLGEYLEQSRPTLFAEPRIRFALQPVRPMTRKFRPPI